MRSRSLSPRRAVTTVALVGALLATLVLSIAVAIWFLVLAPFLAAAVY